jgi:predicted metal-dependent peptidase
MDHVKLLNRAKIDLLDPPDGNPTKSPVFYSSVLFSLKHIWKEEVGTAAVDGKNLFICPTFWCKLTPGGRVFVLAHECLHPILEHLTLFKRFNLKKFDDMTEHRLWNYAGDYVINLMLVDAGYEMPTWALYDERFRGMTTYQVYKILHDEYKQKPWSLEDGDIIFPDDDGSAEAERRIGELKRHITDITVKASIQSEMAGEHPGTLPAEVRRVLKEALNPRLPFEIILANYMTAQYGASDYTFAKPNRRFFPDVYMPGVQSPNLCNIACAFDVSGSVTDEELNSFGAGVRIIMEQLLPEKITVIEFDTELHGEPKELTEGTIVEDIKFHGGGGTDVTPVFRWANKNKPEVILIFTDGGFDMPDMGVDSDIIWIIHGNPNWAADNGKVIHYKL